MILRFESKPTASRNFNRGENATDLCKFARCPPRRVFTLGSVQPDYLENASHTSSILLERKCTDIDETVSPSSFTLLSSKRLKKKRKKVYNHDYTIVNYSLNVNDIISIIKNLLKDFQNLMLTFIISNWKFRIFSLSE